MKQLSCLIASIFIAFNSYSQKNITDTIITKQLLQQYVQTLAHDSMQGRYTGTAGCEKAAAWIAGEMKAIGLNAPYADRNFFHFYKIANGADTITAANVIGFLPGKISDKFIIFSAHYDHVGDSNQQHLAAQYSPSRKDKIYNGANDNASGVAAMLALAKYYQHLNDNHYSILFIAFSGEESGLLGSTALVNSFKNTSSILQVINLEMLGRFPSNRKKPFVTEGKNSFGFVKKLNQYLQQMDPTVKNKYFQTDGFPLENYFSRSDNYSFAIKGVPANTIMATTGLDKYYHTPFDEWQTLDYEAMATVVHAIALSCTPLIQQ